MADLNYDKREGYALFTFDRPERLNALSSVMSAELDAAVADFDADPAMRTGIVTGNGRAFCAGADLKEVAELQRVGKRLRAPGGGSMGAMSFSTSPKPFIAAVNGLAVGGGFELALDCDLRICSTAAWFGLFEPKRGLMAGYGMHHLPRLIGHAAASQILLTADRVDAAQALAWGIVSEVVAPERLLPRAVELARSIAGNAPLSIRAHKAAMQVWRKGLMAESLRLHDELDPVVRNSEDAREGTRAFAEKRAPVWKGC